MSNHKTKSLAVLIDADNAQSGRIEALLAEIAKYGTAHVKRAYGDWTSTNLNGWKNQLLEHSVQPVQQFAYTKGKNATDSAMIIDAMDLLHSQRFDGFCLVSSDSDFTRLASRIREAGLTVYGFGERKTPEPFLVACDRFVYVENMTLNHDHGSQIDTTPAAGGKPGVQRADDPELTAWLQATAEAVSEDDGWAMLSKLASHLDRQRPDFDPRAYGYSQLRKLIAATALFEIAERTAADGTPTNIYVRSRNSHALMTGIASC